MLDGIAPAYIAPIPAAFKDENPDIAVSCSYGGVGTCIPAFGRYNEVCAEGPDTDFGKAPRFLLLVQNPPFYAHANAGAPGFALVTTGGFVTDNDQMVLDEYYNPIEGLYATGNCCGLRFGTTYITPIPGVSIGLCYTLGRKLGEHLATK